MRFERKYKLNHDSVSLLMDFLISKGFSESFPDRLISSVYFDTRDLNFLQESLDGISKRKKYRVRWYNEDLKNSRFEVKIKEEMLGRKVISNIGTNYSINSFSDLLNSVYGVDNDPCILDQSKYMPVLLVKYDREYYESTDGLIRATIDKNIQCGKVSSQLSSKKYSDIMLVHDSVVLEFKYDDVHDDYFRSLISNDIKIRSTKYSKYTNSYLIMQNAGLV